MIKHPKLQDAHAMSILHPDTFQLPSKTQIERLQPGDFVQVNYNGKRFWCRLIFRRGNDMLGIIDNELGMEELQADDVIAVNTVNIYKVLPDDKREKLPRFMLMPVEESGSLYILHTQMPRFIAKFISEKPVRMKDVAILDEPVDYASEMPALLKEMADWFYYKHVNKK